MAVHWATLALRDIKDALDDTCFDSAVAHLEEAITSILENEKSATCNRHCCTENHRNVASPLH